MAAIVCCFGIIVYLWAGTTEHEVSAAKMQESVAEALDTEIEGQEIQASSIPDQTEQEEISREERISVPDAGGVETALFATNWDARAEQPVTDINAIGDINVTQYSIEEENEQESEYANLAIADVTDYVNVRTEPNTDSEIVGKIYDGAVAQILAVAGEQEDWFQIVSGNVEGYIKAEFFLYGDAAAAVIDEYVTRYAEVMADRLNVRVEPSMEAKRIGYIDNGEKVKLLEDLGEWLKVEYIAGKEGYIAAEYVIVLEEFVYAKTLAEEQAEIAARRALEERTNVQENTAPETLTKIEFPATSYTSNEELRKAIVDYALQYVGNKYVHGGSSLSSGTDCSGFTCFVYADFGYSISRTPSGQYSGAGRSIDYSEIQPGDIICYSSNGGKSCTHVGLYIGDGQIVHAANSRKGVITSAADYSPIIGIRNVID